MRKVSPLNKNLLTGYAQAYMSYLFRDSQLPSLKQAILFGSVARGDFDSKSDVDIFLDTVNEKEMEKATKRAMKRFLSSEEYKKFSLHGIKNTINTLAGQLEKWKLKESVEKEGIILYSRNLMEGDKHFLVRIEPIRNITKRNRVIRRIVGRGDKHFQGKGMVPQCGGEVLDSRVFLIPAGEITQFLKLFSRENIQYKMVEIWK
ncbi:MAG: nucleotidyltransferase domain-containing protein [Candidatus Aenigmarchaeota archaeon]|nr:nucleotidyltransferase domain-containing protein [Candidatus Aenigmarchaeota archaeon]